jgi:hypothetical protein
MVLAWVLSGSAYAQSVSTTMGARWLALGQAASTGSDIWAAQNNPAGMVGVTNASGAFTYEVAALPGADRLATALVVPAAYGHWGMSVFRFGDAVYSEQLISASFANKLGIASLGGRINYVQYTAEGIGRSHHLTVDFGGVAELSKTVAIGALVTNLTRTRKSGATDERLPSRLITGVRFTLSERFRWVGEVEKDIDYKPVWRSGFEYNYAQKVFFRAGYQLPLRTVSFGLGLHKSRLGIDYGFQWQRSLGPAHQGTLIYKFRKT